ncbi:MAG: hypothetical protein AAF191_14445 [Verrucomicrobiota bacterium]
MNSLPPSQTTIAPHLKLWYYPLSLLGANFGRNAVGLSLPNGDLLIHSSGPFSEEEVAELRSMGTPRYLLEATPLHDTFLRKGSATFPEASLLAHPSLFSQAKGMAGQSDPALKASSLKRQGIHLIPIQGLFQGEEWALYEERSQTLILADMLVQVDEPVPALSRPFVRMAGLTPGVPSIDRLFRLCIKHRTTFRKSIPPLLDLPIQTLIPAHGVPIQEQAKDILLAELETHDLLP